MYNPWNSYAQRRHTQIISGKDISYDHVLLKTIIRLLEMEHLGKKSHLLDIGCSTGILISRIYKPDWTITGIDSSYSSIKIAKKYLKNTKGVKLLTRSIINLQPCKHNLYDVVIANMVFHTIKNFGAALRACHRLLKQNGALIISMPHPRYWLLYQGIEKAETFDYETPKKYLIDFKITNDQTPFPEKVPYYHRPISFYENWLTKAGFSLHDIFSPTPDKEIMRLYKKNWEHPHFLFFYVKKEKSNGN